jgi:DNA-binding CsgD family transcriptional regulator/tetratricopeptide (TPR) repeat protein
MAATAPAAGLYGRAAEVGELSQALGLASSGRLAVVLVDGEAGIGKTRLLDEALTTARGRGMQVASGRAEELERTRPFGLIADALGCTRTAADPRRSAIAALLGGHRGDDGAVTVSSDPGLQYRAVDALTDLAEELALAGPLVIGLDDLQWADPSSLLTVGALARRLADLPAAIIACSRPAPRVPSLQRLYNSLERSDPCLITLRGLAEDAVTELVAATVAAEPGPGLRTEVAGAAGNPLFVTELLGAILQDGILRISEGRADVAEMTLPPSLRLTILRRLSFLPEDSLQALRAGSILGSSFSLTGLSVTTGRPALALSLDLEEAVRARVLEDDGDRLRFRHDLIREAIYVDLPASVRLGLHREAAQRLAAAGTPALQVAEQFSRGASPGDTEAIGWLTRAAREAAPSSPDTAADLLERAVGLMRPLDPDRDRVLAERAGSLMMAGRIPEAEAACRDLLGRGHEPRAGALARICLGQVLLTQGRARDGLRELEQAADSDGLTMAERAKARGWVGGSRWALGDLEGAARAGQQARSEADAADDHLATSIALTALAQATEQRGQLREALQIMDGALRRADDSPARAGHRFPVQLHRGHILIGLDRVGDAAAAMAASRRISEELGVRWPLVTNQAHLGLQRYVAGEWDDAVAELEAGIGLAEETGETFGLILGHNLLSLIRLHRGDLSGAGQAAAAARALLAAAGPRNCTYGAMWARALLLEAEGRPAEAFSCLAGIWDQYARWGMAAEYPVVGPDLVRLAVAVGDAARAQQVAAAVAGVAAANEVPFMTGAALRCRGLAEDDAGLLADAVRAYARGPRPLELALAAEEAGVALARRGDTGGARRFVERAIAAYEGLEAARDLARAEAVLRDLGVRRGRRGPRGRPQHGWASLTETECTVAGLVAEGLSNPQIGDRLYVSRRTVQTHVAHIFTKLDLSSRAQLAAEVTRQPGVARAAPRGPSPG